MREIGLLILYGLTTYDDIKTRQIRVAQIIMFGLVGVALNFYKPENSLISVVGGLLIGALVYAFSLLSKEKIGKGDALIVIVTGLYMGYMNTMVLLWISSILAVIGGLIAMRILKVDKDYEMPFMPFMLAGLIVMISTHLIRSAI